LIEKQPLIYRVCVTRNVRYLDLAMTLALTSGLENVFTVMPTNMINIVPIVTEIPPLSSSI